MPNKLCFPRATKPSNAKGSVVVRCRMQVKCQFCQQPDQSSTSKLQLQQQYHSFRLVVLWYSVLAPILQALTPTAVVPCVSQARV